jgi:excisionase family DNA binding protein
MTCTRIKLDVETTVIFVRDGWLIVEVADADAVREQLNGTDGSRLLSVAEVSERTGFTCGAIRAWIKRAALNAVRIGKEYRIREADLQAFLDSPKRSQASDGRIGRRRKPVVA